MKFTVEVSNPFHMGWITAHLGQPPKAPEGLSDIELNQFKHGFRTYQESLRGMPLSSRMAMTLEEFSEQGVIKIERHELRSTTSPTDPNSPTT
jgi:N-formylglutamate amidohydrolase